MVFKIAQNSQNVWATFERKFIIQKFQKSGRTGCHELIGLAGIAVMSKYFAANRMYSFCDEGLM